MGGEGAGPNLALIQSLGAPSPGLVISLGFLQFLLVRSVELGKRPAGTCTPRLQRRYYNAKPTLDGRQMDVRLTLTRHCHWVGRTSQLSGIGAIFLVSVTDFAMDLSAKTDGFCGRFCGGCLACVSLKEKRRVLGRILGPCELGQRRKKGRNLSGVKIHSKSTIKIYAELQVKHAAYSGDKTLTYLP